jgi:hypothetical protein
MIVMASPRVWPRQPEDRLCEAISFLFAMDCRVAFGSSQ